MEAAIALSQFFDGHPVATFAIDNAHVITQWNKACERLLGWSAHEMIGTGNHGLAFFGQPRQLLCDLIVDADAPALARRVPSDLIAGAYEAEDFFPQLGAAGHWLHFTAAPLHDENGRLVGAIETLLDVTERRVAENALRRSNDNLEHIVEKRTSQLAEANKKLERDLRQRQSADAELRRRNVELTQLNDKLSMAQQQLLQAEKMASIGQLAAGVAHEINNPIGYVFSNVGTLQTYLADLFAMLDSYQAAENALADPAVARQLAALRLDIDLDFLRGDIPLLMRESQEGIARVRHIVQDLKDFSRADAQQQWIWANLHQGIDSTLNIVSHEIKYKAELVKQYGHLPDIECLPSQLNQVIMNLVVNAAHAITRHGTITIRTGHDSGRDQVWISVGDTGAGIAAENLTRIFDPFFTTKAIGQGTGLGLSLAYGIIKKHHGRIDVDSVLGQGSTFRITLPVRQQQEPSHA